MREFAISWAASLSVLGLVLGLLFFCGSLTPSLLPRAPVAQGLLAGLALAVGYALGVAVVKIWRFLQLRELTGRAARVVKTVALAAAIVLAVATLPMMTDWQNSIRTLMEMPPVDSAYPLTVLSVALVVAVVLVLLARGLIRATIYLSHWLRTIMPPRVALVVSTAVVVVVVASLVNGMVIKRAVRMMDEAFAAIDQATDDDVVAPESPWASGGPDSLIRWQDIGKNGKRFVALGPTRDQIQSLTGRPAVEPIRVYAGYNTGDSLEERAEIALSELVRVGGFDREVLVVATPTGTGWLDPSAVDPLMYLHDGDIALVSMQYSYLPSWLTIIVDPDRSRRSAKALFDEVYEYWTELPADERPRLYLQGLSLGSLGSEAALDPFQMLGDPIDGAVLSGPPFPSTIWPDLVANRRQDTPPWRPIFRQGRLVRFMNQQGMATPHAADWGVLRWVYIQHASDPMIFFSPDLLYRQPDWLGADRGPDVSPSFRWMPIVTFLQVGFDVPMATAAPLGYAHNYAPAEYIDAWIAVTEPADWTPSDTAALKARYADFNPSPL